MSLKDELVDLAKTEITVKHPNRGLTGFELLEIVALMIEEAVITYNSKNAS